MNGSESFYVHQLLYRIHITSKMSARKLRNSITRSNYMRLFARQRTFPFEVSTRSGDLWGEGGMWDRVLVWLSGSILFRAHPWGEDRPDLQLYRRDFFFSCSL